MDTSESHDKQGHILAGRYEIISEIGRGGFGMVYRARQINIGREVAIKVLPPQFMAISDVVERFKREAKLTSQLTHPNTITIHDYGQAENLLFIVMELLDGEDLADVLRREHTLPQARILHIAQQILKSLAEAHQKGIVHRDLKPENIYLCPTSEGDEIVKVLDFGIAKLAQPDSTSLQGKQLTVTGSTVGTPVYMSPEQAAGEEVDHLTDLYALGIMIYEMACGKPPFHDANPVKIMRSHLFTEVPPFPVTSPLSGSHLERVVMRALQKEKHLRFQSAREFLTSLDASKPTITALPSSLISGLHAVSVTEEEDDLPTIELVDSSTEESIDLLTGSNGSSISTLNNSTGKHLAQTTDPHADAIPFDSLLSNLEPPSRERVLESTSSSSSLNLAAPIQLQQEGMDGHGLNTSSAILSIIEHAPTSAPSPDEEVFVLTQPKKPSSSFKRDDLDVGEGRQAPVSLGPIEVTPRQEGRGDDVEPGVAPKRQPGRNQFQSEGWSWDPSTTPDTRGVDSGAYPQLKQKQHIKKENASKASSFLIILIVMGLLGAAAIAAWFILGG